MSVGQATYGAEYYATHCGPIPYDRSQPAWGAFFGTIAADLIRTFRPLRVFDAGCAHGFLIEALWDRGVEAFGRDISDFAISRVRADVRPFCEVGSLADPIGGRYDLVVCIEVLEHMPEEEARRAIANMAAVTDRIVFSSSPSDLEEPTHANVKPAIYWLRLFAAEGLAPVPSLTMDSITPHALVFERGEAGRSERDLAVCAEMVRLRLHRAEHDAALAGLRAELERSRERSRQNEAALASLGQRLDERDRILALRHRELRDARLAEDARTALHCEQIGEFERRLLAQQAVEAELRHSVAHLQSALNTVLSTTIWRGTWILRAAGDLLPPSARRALRRAMQALWWAATLQLPRRLRQRRSRRLAIQQAARPAAGSFDDPAPVPVAAAVPPASPPDAAQIRRSGLFDAAFYRRAYPDVVKLGFEPLEHYVRFGWKENRMPNELFDGAYYLANNEDVARAGANPLLHYAWHGAWEGRDPHPEFSTNWYVATAPGLKPGGINPLAHYLRHGRQHGLTATSPVLRYRAVLARQRVVDADERPELLQHVSIMTYRPTFIVFVEGEDEDARTATLGSLARQVYPASEVRFERWGVLQSLAAHDLASTYLIWLRAGDMLSEMALYAFASALNARPDLDLIYADEDRWDADGRLDPFFKPDWSPDLLESFDYLFPSACVRAALARNDFETALNKHDFALRLTERTTAIQHVRQTLCHRQEGASAPIGPERSAQDIEALNARLHRTGRSGVVTQAVNGRAVYRTKVEIPRTPLVSIVIPTAGKIVEVDGRPIDLLVNCIDTIVALSSYRNFEFVIVDNGDLDRSRLAHVTSVPLRFTTYVSPALNIAAKLNAGARLAAGTALLLLNDDVEPLVADWIEQMLAHLEKPHVGIVGAKLLYPDMTIQHHGVVLNACSPDHVSRYAARENTGYFYSLIAQRNCIGVTGACMLTRTELFKSVGGYTEDFGISYNDIDYCMKVAQLGLTVVMAPDAELIHFESQSRVATLDLAERERFWSRWAAIYFDPFYNEEELDVSPPTYTVRHNTRVL